MSRYAAETSVSQDRSRAEIEATLKRYGATSFMYASEQTAAMIGFRISDRMVKFVLPMPDPKSREFTHTPARGTLRSPAEAEKAWEQAGRQRWRALALVIKAKLEAVEAGIVTFDEAFAMHFLLPNGQTVGEWVTPQIAQVYAAGEMPALLPGGAAR